MLKRWLPVSAAILWAVSAWAQSVEQIEIFGGYSYAARDFSGGTIPSSSLNRGRTASVNLKFLPRLGLVSDVAGYYNHQGAGTCGGGLISCSSNVYNNNNGRVSAGSWFGSDDVRHQSPGAGKGARRVQAEIWTYRIGDCRAICCRRAVGGESDAGRASQGDSPLTTAGPSHVRMSPFDHAQGSQGSSPRIYFLRLLFSSSFGSARKCCTLAITVSCFPARSTVSLRSWPGWPSSMDQTCPMVESGTGVLSTATR